MIFVNLSFDLSLMKWYFNHNEIELLDIEMMKE